MARFGSHIAVIWLNYRAERLLNWRGFHGKGLQCCLVSYFSQHLHERCKLFMAEVSSVFDLGTKQGGDDGGNNQNATCG